MKYRNVIFDLDGTLFDSFEGVGASIVYAYEQLGVAVPDEPTLRTFLGPSLYDSFGRVSGFDDATRRRAIELYRAVYNTENYKRTKFYPGMRELVETLKAAGIRVCVATSKPANIVGVLFRHMGIDNLFDAVFAADPSETGSDKQTLVQRAAALASPAVMVGDRKFDMQAAAAVGIDAIGVTFGFGSREELAAFRTVLLAENAEQIAAFILNG